jgi:Fe-S-cluster-containing dehydrogenase component
MAQRMTSSNAAGLNRVDQESKQIRRLIPAKNFLPAYRNKTTRFDIGHLDLPADAPGQTAILLPVKDGYSPVPARRRGRFITATLPEDVESGYVVLKTKAAHSRKSGGKDQESAATIEDDLCVRKKGVSLPVLRETARIIGYLSLSCDECTINCPHDALAADPDGVCTVDPEKCMGEAYFIPVTNGLITVNGNQVFDKVPLSNCWSCFNPDETVSTRCNLRRLRKVVYNSGVCCGDCNVKSRYLGYNLMALCQEGAVSHTSTGVYAIDPELCTGCRTCYDNIACMNNLHYVNSEGELRENITLKMVAYADDRSARLYLTVESVKLLNPDYYFKGAIYLALHSDLDTSLLKLSMDPNHKVRIDPVTNNTAIGRDIHLALVEHNELMPGLMRNPGSRALPITPLRWSLTPPFCQDVVVGLAGNSIQVQFNIHE